MARCCCRAVLMAGACWMGSGQIGRFVFAQRILNIGLVGCKWIEVYTGNLGKPCVVVGVGGRTGGARTDRLVPVARWSTNGHQARWAVVDLGRR